MRRAAVLIVLAASLATASSRAAFAQWPAGGVPVGTALGDRWAPVVCSDGAGGGIVGYLESARTRAQAFGAFAAPDSGWSALDGRLVAPDAPMGNNLQRSVRIATDGAGGAFVLWHDQRHSGCGISCEMEYGELYVTHLLHDGSIAAGWSSAGDPIGTALNYMYAWGNGPGNPTDFNPVVAPDSEGGLLVAWTENWYPVFSGAVAGVHAQRVAADGRLLWGARGVLVAHARGLQAYPAIAASGDGGATILWQDSRDDTTSFRIYGQRLSADGAPIWTDGGRPVTHGLVRGEASVMIAGLDRGELSFGWLAGAAPDSVVAMAQRVDATGAPVWPGDVMLSGPAHAVAELDAARDAGGGAIFAWTDGSAEGNSFRALRLTRTGVPACGWAEDGNTVSAAAIVPRGGPKLVAGASGDAFVAWVEADQPRVARMTASGALADGWSDAGLLLSGDAGYDGELAVAPDGEGGALVAWSNVEAAYPGDGIVRLQRLSRSGVWSGTSGPADPLPDSCVTIAQPAVEGFRPNPTRAGAATVSFVLPSAGSVRLELYDLTGRRLGSQDQSGLAAGRHTIPLMLRRSVPPGVYFVRLTQGGRSSTARGVVLP